jgi:predicted transcriptional regulator
MSKKLKELLERVTTWPETAQEEAQTSLEAIEQDLSDSYVLTDDDRAALERSAEDVRRGRFASDEEVCEVFDRYRHP